MTCGKCGHKNSRKNEFCSECGASLIKDVSKKEYRKMMGKFSNKEIIKRLYGKRYELSGSLFFLLVVPFSIITVLIGLVLLSSYMSCKDEEPVNFTKNAEANAYVNDYITKIDIIANYDSNTGVYCAALTEGGKSCVLNLNKETYLNDFSLLPRFFDYSSAPAEKGIEVVGMCYDTDENTINACIEKGFCKNSADFETLFGKYTIEAGATPTSSYGWFLLYTSLPAVIVYILYYAFSVKYIRLKKYLNRLRQKGSIDSVEALFDYTPFNVRKHQLALVNGLFFSPFDGCLVRISDLLMIRFTPPNGVNTPGIFYFHCEDGTKAQIVTSTAYEKYIDVDELINRLKQRKPDLLIGTNRENLVAYKEMVKEYKENKGIQKKISSGKAEVFLIPAIIVVIALITRSIYIRFYLRNYDFDFTFSMVMYGLLLALLIIFLYPLYISGLISKKRILKKYSYMLRDSFSHNRRARKALERAVLFFDTKQTLSAISVLRGLVSSCRLPHDFSSVYYLLAVCLERTENTYEPSIESFKIALQHDNSFFRLWYDLGVVYEHSGDFLNAKYAYLNSQKIGADPRAVNNAIERLERIKEKQKHQQQ